MKRLGRSWPNNLWREHGRVLLLYAGLSLLVTWPTIQHFTTAITSDGGDARHLVWWLWRTREALLGQQPLFYAPLVYYPLGISLLANAEGPVAGLFALPFWGWGPEAAYNGTLLLGVTLTGYCMYVLARGLGFDRLVAFFAGLMLLMAPMHLAGLLAHVDKTFLGLFPLTLLAVQRALDPTGGCRRAIVVGGLLLITLLYDGWHFVLAALAVGFFLIAAWFSSERPHWPRLFKREVLIGMCCLLCVGPLLIAIVSASRSFESSFNRNLISAELQPDLAEFFLPGQSTQLFGPGTASFLAAHEVTGTIETAVALAYVGLVLCGAALISRDRSAWRWLLFCLICVSLALGPSLKVLGQTQFTEYRLPLILPYAFLTALPGLDFMRTPGRFMLIGYVGFGIAASYG
ncbi:MAG TPA: hypothetical protein VFF59_11850, partial [Anaerolineae bacterium]|nr:hypothetical protein [Anaerolineae bacterium]